MSDFGIPVAEYWKGPVGPHIPIFTVSEPHTGNLTVSEPHIYNLTVSEPIPRHTEPIHIALQKWQNPGHTVTMAIQRIIRVCGCPAVVAQWQLEHWWLKQYRCPRFDSL